MHAYPDRAKVFFDTALIYVNNIIKNNGEETAEIIDQLKKQVIGDHVEDFDHNDIPARKEPNIYVRTNDGKILQFKRFPITMWIFGILVTLFSFYLVYNLTGGP